MSELFSRLGKWVKRLTRPVQGQQREKQKERDRYGVPLLPVTDWRSGSFGLEDEEELDLDLQQALTISNSPVQELEFQLTPPSSPCPTFEPRDATLPILTVDGYSVLSNRYEKETSCDPMHPFFNVCVKQTNRYPTQNNYVSASCSFELTNEIDTKTTVDMCTLDPTLRVLLEDESRIPLLVDGNIVLSLPTSTASFPVDRAVGVRVPSYSSSQLHDFASQPDIEAYTNSRATEAWVRHRADKAPQPFEITQHLTALLAPSNGSDAGTLASSLDALQRGEWKGVQSLPEPEYRLDLATEVGFLFPTLISFLGGYTCIERFHDDYLVEDRFVLIRDSSDLHYFLAYFATGAACGQLLSTILLQQIALRPGADNRPQQYWVCTDIDAFYWIFGHIGDQQQVIPVFRPHQTVFSVFQLDPNDGRSPALYPLHNTPRSMPPLQTLTGRFDFTVCFIPITAFAHKPEMEIIRQRIQEKNLAELRRCIPIEHPHPGNDVDELDTLAERRAVARGPISRSTMTYTDSKHQDEEYSVGHLIMPLSGSICPV